MRREVIRWTAAVLCTAVFGLATAGEAQPAGQGAESKGPLASLPSKPGPHVEKIKALGDGQWLSLGKPVPDPKWGAAPGRAFTCKMAAAPDLGGAFLYGEGEHGGTTRRGDVEYYNDDLFFYDLNAHAWVCCHPGTPVKGPKLKFDPKLKCEVNDNGEPLPVAVMIHGYADTAYSSKRKLFAGLPNGSYFYWGKDLGRRRESKNVEEMHKQGPWLYDAAGGKWELRLKSGGPKPEYGGVLEFVQRGGQELLFRYVRDGAVWLYDLDKREWSEAKPKGPRPPWGIEPNACYDTKRNRIYMGGGQYPEAKDTNALWAYDIKDNGLIDLKARDSKLRLYATWGAVMTYDSVNDKVVLMRSNPSGGGPVGIFVYDPETNAWSDSQPFPKEVAWQKVNGFYSAELNAHVYHSAGDSVRDGVIHVYRLKAAAK